MPPRRSLRLHRLDRLDRHDRSDYHILIVDRMQPGPVRCKIDKFRNARFKRASPAPKEKQKERTRDQRPKIEMRSVKLAINHNAERDKIENDSGRDHPIAETGPGQPFCAAVILRHRLKQDAPPKVTVNLDVPFVPTGIDRVTPTFFFEHVENLAEEMMAISRVIAPENTTAQTAHRFGFCGQIFVRANHATRRPFEMQPGKVTGKSANE